MPSIYTVQLNEHIAVMELVHELAPLVEKTGQAWKNALNNNGKILLMGNGGNAANALHITAELAGRHSNNRRVIPAIALSADTSVLTAVSNQFGYDQVFARQIGDLANTQDIIMAYSHTGEDTNLLAAIELAQEKGCITVALTGKTGGKLKAMVDICLCVPSDNAPRIKEAHVFIGHMLSEMLDNPSR